MKKALTVLVMMTVISMPVKAHGDMPSDWAVAGIETVKVSGIVNMDRFHIYDKPITRLSYAYLMYQLYEYLTGEPILSAVDLTMDNAFSDFIQIEEVPESDGHESAAVDNLYLKSLKAAGLMKGYPDGSFRPNDFITREEIMVLYARVIEKAGYELEESEHFFDDADLISEWAYDSIMKCYRLGLVKGVGKNRIDPQGYATVEESLVVLSRIIEDPTVRPADIKPVLEAKPIVSNGSLTFSIDYDMRGEAYGIDIYDDYRLLGEVHLKEGITDQGLFIYENHLYFWDGNGRLNVYDGVVEKTGFMIRDTIDRWYIKDDVLHYYVVDQWTSYDLNTGRISGSAGPWADTAVKMEDSVLYYMDKVLTEKALAYSSSYGKVYCLTEDRHIVAYDTVMDHLIDYGETDAVAIDVSWNYLILKGRFMDGMAYTRYLPAFDLETYID